MAKQSGIGDNFYLGGYDLSGDVNSIGQLGGGPALLDVTAVKSSANERIGGLRDGDWQFVSFWDFASTGQGVALNALDSLPTSDVIGTYFRGTTLQAPAASIVAKQLNMDPTRDASGNLTLAVELQANAHGMEWGEQLTAGLRTDTEATVGAYVDDGASSSYGAQAYLQLVAFTGTSVDVAINHCSTSGGSYSSLIDFGAQTGVGAWRGSVSNTTTVDEFLQVTTTGTFTEATFAVAFMRNPVAGITF